MNKLVFIFIFICFNTSEGTTVTNQMGYESSQDNKGINITNSDDSKNDGFSHDVKHNYSNSTATITITPENIISLDEGNNQIFKSEKDSDKRIEDDNIQNYSNSTATITITPENIISLDEGNNQIFKTEKDSDKRIEDDNIHFNSSEHRVFNTNVHTQMDDKPNENISVSSDNSNNFPKKKSSLSSDGLPTNLNSNDDGHSSIVSLNQQHEIRNNTIGSNIYNETYIIPSKINMDEADSIYSNSSNIALLSNTNTIKSHLVDFLDNSTLVLNNQTRLQNQSINNGSENDTLMNQKEITDNNDSDNFPISNTSFISISKNISQTEIKSNNFHNITNIFLDDHKSILMNSDKLYKNEGDSNIDKIDLANTNETNQFVYEAEKSVQFKPLQQIKTSVIPKLWTSRPFISTETTDVTHLKQRRIVPGVTPQTDLIEKEKDDYIMKNENPEWFKNMFLDGPQITECNDEYSSEDCRHFFDEGYCRDSLINKRCHKTCDNCGLHSNDGICEDYPTRRFDCEAEKKAGTCSMGMVKNFCSRTCGLCNDINIETLESGSGEFGIFYNDTESHKVYERYIKVKPGKCKSGITVEITKLSISNAFLYCMSNSAYVEIADTEKEKSATNEQKRLCTYDGCLRLCNSFDGKTRNNAKQRLTESSKETTFRIRFRPMPGSQMKDEGFHAKWYRSLEEKKCKDSDLCNKFPMVACNSDFVANHCPCKCECR